MLARHPFPTCVAVIVLAACGSHGGERPASECFGYTVPPGWKPEPSKTGAALVLGAPTEFPLGTKSMHDTIIVRFIPGDIGLESFKTQLLDGLARTPKINEYAARAGSANPAAPPIHVDDVPAPKVTSILVGGHEGFRVDVRTKLQVGELPVESINVTEFIKFGTEIVSVAAGYLAERETVAKPVSDAFLASLNFDRCRN